MKVEIKYVKTETIFRKNNATDNKFVIVPF
nr:MAG TPA: hypothetical protein [Caudoviricetes sp.]